MTYYRLLGPGDVPAIRAHLAALSTDDRYARFHTHKSDDLIDDYIAHLDWQTHQIIGCFRDGHLIGMSEVHFDRPFAPKNAEIAVSVDSSERGHGIGRQLVARAGRQAARRHVHQATLHFLSRNNFIPRIVRKLGGSVDIMEGEAILPTPQLPAYLDWIEQINELGTTLLAVFTQSARRAA